MINPGAILDKIYRKIGDKGTVFVIFFTGIFVHTLFALKMEMLSIDPNEFGVMAWSALFSGKNWTNIVSKIGYYYGYGGAILYTPLFIFIKNSFTLYKAILILNGVIVSIVPVIAYHIGRLLGMEKAWNRLLLALVCGIYSTTFAHTKFAWNETACIIIPWLLIFLLLQTDNIGNKVAKHFMSVLTAFAAVFAYSAHPRLLSVTIAAVVIILFARLAMKKKLVFLSSFIPALAVFAVLEFMLRTHLMNVMWGENRAELQNTFGSIFGKLSGLFTENGITRFFETLCGHLYYFATSTWGLGSIALCLVFTSVFSYFKSKKHKTEKNKYTDSFVIFAVFGFFSNLLSMLVSVIDKFGAAGFEQYQDTVIFGRYIDSVIPLLIMLVISYVFINSLDFTKLLGAFVILGVIYALFFIFTAPIIINAPNTRVSPILGLYPIRIGENIDATITIDGLLLTVSCVFCFVALFVVIVCCSVRYRKHIISLCMVCTMLYSSLYTAIVYLPFAANEASTVNTPIYELSESIYNSSDAPYVYTYKSPRRTTTLLQFLNQETLFFTVGSIGELPENCFIVVPNSERLVLKPDSQQLFWELTQTEEYTLYAYGERATAFAQSQGLGGN